MTRVGNRFSFEAIRRAEALFDPSQLRFILFPWIWLACLRGIRKGKRRLPGYIPVQQHGWMWEHSPSAWADQLLEFFPDRLGLKKWNSRLRIDGWEHLRSACDAQRPVVLAFCHFGPYQLMRSWLRSRGIPAATAVYGESPDRSVLRQLTDKVTPLPGVPIVWYLDQVRPMVEFLRQGNVLLISVDYSVGRQVNVPMADGWTFEMATGAIRLAASTQAALLPCVIVDAGKWKFDLHIGPQVPEALVKDAHQRVEAGKRVLEFMLPHFRQYPQQCTARLLRRFRKDPATQRASFKSDEPDHATKAVAR